MKSDVSQEEFTPRHSDEALVRDAQEGDARARRMLVERYRSLLDWHTRRYTAHPQVSEDYQQEAMLGFWRAVESYNPTADVLFKTYATTCVTNALASAARRYERLYRGMALEADVEGGGDLERYAAQSAEEPESVLSDFQASEVRRLLAEHLSPLEYQCLFYNLEGYSHKEIAERVHANIRAVGNAITRANKKARALLPHS